MGRKKMKKKKKEKNEKEKKREYGRRELTERIPHPVGINANMQANISGNVKSVNTTAIARPVSAIKKERPWMKRNKSWKLTDIFWLKVKTCENTKKYEMKG